MKLLLAMIAALTLAGCAVHTPRASVSIGTGWGYDGGYYGGGYYRDYDDGWGYRGGHPGRFCPPGQAKKGRC